MRLKIMVMINRAGITVKVHRASSMFMFSIMVMIPISKKISPKILTTPCVNIWFSDSTSEATRVISRPTGFLSKKERESRCKCIKISERRLYISFCPIYCVVSDCAYCTTKMASITPIYQNMIVYSPSRLDWLT